MWLPWLYSGGEKMGDAEYNQACPRKDYCKKQGHSCGFLDVTQKDYRIFDMCGFRFDGLGRRIQITGDGKVTDLGN
jgi:hypothetical protein